MSAVSKCQSGSGSVTISRLVSAYPGPTTNALNLYTPCGSPDKQMTIPSVVNSSKPTPEFRIYPVSKGRSGLQNSRGQQKCRLQPQQMFASARRSAEAFTPALHPSH